MRNKFEWAIEGIFRKGDGCLDHELYRNEDLKHLLFRAAKIETEHPEYLCVNMLLICEVGDEDTDAEFGRAYIKRSDRKWILHLLATTKARNWMFQSCITKSLRRFLTKVIRT